MESGKDMHYHSSHYTWDDIARQYEKIIERLASEQETTK
jgi:hypothetical protein